MVVPSNPKNGIDDADVSIENIIPTTHQTMFPPVEFSTIETETGTIPNNAINNTFMSLPTSHITTKSTVSDSIPVHPNSIPVHTLASSVAFPFSPPLSKIPVQILPHPHSVSIASEHQTVPLVHATVPMILPPNVGLSNPDDSKLPLVSIAPSPAIPMIPTFLPADMELAVVDDNMGIKIADSSRSLHVGEYKPRIKKASSITKFKTRRQCRFPGCTKTIKSQGHCQRHGARAKRCNK